MNRKFDKLGRIVIPKEMRDKIGLGEAGNEAKIELIGNKIIISNPDTVDLITYIEQQLEHCEGEDAATAYTDILMKLKR